MNLMWLVLLLSLVLVVSGRSKNEPHNEHALNEYEDDLKGFIQKFHQKKTNPIDEEHYHEEDNDKPKKKHGKKKKKIAQKEREDSWLFCSDEKPPVSVNDVTNTPGVMCSDMYPVDTCCSQYDITRELEGDKLLESINGAQCIRMLMKLRCAHCSPRSWWLFHAPDHHRLPHKREFPIMCPGFCRKFHRICRDSVAGLEDDNFCQYHTSPEEGPCFPDSIPKRGTID